MSRKAELLTRALDYAELCGDHRVGRFYGFSAGYRAALKDARKAIREDIDTNTRIYSHCHDYLFPSIRKFLRAIR